MHQWQENQLQNSKHSIPVLGACVLEVTHQGKAAKVYFVIVQDALKIKDTTAQIVDQNNDLFEGLGCLPGEHKLSIDPAVTPVVSPCRKIPFALHEKL